MLDDELTGAASGEPPTDSPAPPKTRRRATKKAAAPAADDSIPAVVEAAVEEVVAKKVAKRVRKAAPAKKAAKAAAPPQETADEPSSPAAPVPADSPAAPAPTSAEEPFASATDRSASATEPLAPTMKTPRRATRRAAAPPAVAFIAPAPDAAPLRPVSRPAPTELAELAQPAGRDEAAEDDQQPPVDLGDEPTDARSPRRRGRRGRGRGRGGETAESGDQADDSPTPPSVAAGSPDGDPGLAGQAGAGLRRPGSSGGEDGDVLDSGPAAPADAEQAEDGQPEAAEESDDGEESASTRRRRRRRRRTPGEAEAEEAPATDPPNTVVRVRKTRPPRGRDTDDEVQGVKGSVRLEAKRQRRRDGRDQSRRRPPIITEAEFLARREAVDRTMVVRQVADRTQIAVLEDGVLVEHYVTKASANAYAGNVYLGKVQNVLSSMEAAFVDIGKSRNAVLYAGEVNWDAAGIEGRSRRIEDALKAGQSVLCQVTKDPVGQKGARLTSQISLPGRFLVYVPEGQMTGISRKLPDVERKRLKDILKKLVPEDAGVIIRTAAEGASEEELTSDVERLQAQWDAIKAKAAKAAAPALLYGEPDLVVRVVRDIFNEDFASLVVAGDEAWDQVQEYVSAVSPDLVDRLSRHEGDSDVFADLRIDEQLAKGLDRKVYLPSGGSLVIDRTEAMTVVDVNTGKFIGKGGNLEETVTRNNLEAAEEIVRQLRLRDIGGMIVIDFIDMILESNRDLVLRRLTECLGRDRTRHQVAEVTSLGLVQMTRKRVGQGLLEAFSEPCQTCQGRGLIVHMEPVEHSTAAEQRHEVSPPLVRRHRAQGPPPGLEVVAAATARVALPPPTVVDSPDGALSEPVVADEPAGGALPDAPTGQPLADAVAEPAPERAPQAPDEAPEVMPAVQDVSAPPPPRRRRAASRPAGPPAEISDSVTVSG